MSETWSRGDLEYLAACPACGEKVAGQAQYARRDDFLAMPDVWCFWRCPACASLYLNPRPDVASLPRAYQNYYTHYAEADALASGEARGIKAALVNGYLNWRFRMHRQPASWIGALLFGLLRPLGMKLDFYGRHLPKNLCNAHTRLLDVGCGNGGFLLRAKQMGIVAAGCEPDRHAADTCVTLGLDVVKGDAFAVELDHERFDVITLNHVIEHVRDPIGLLERLHLLLLPGGRLWMALPNPDALGVVLFKAAWKGFHPPFHLIIPHQKVLLRWARRAGFVDVRCLRRGAQSRGLWTESTRIARREQIRRSESLISACRFFGDMLSTFSPRWGEETVIVAHKPR